jgi:hypothetical protein
MKKLLLILSMTAVIGNVSAQNIQFYIDTNQIFLPDQTNLNRTNFNAGALNVSVYGSTVASLQSLVTAVDQFSASASTGDALAAFNTLILDNVFAGPGSGDSWNSIGVSPGTGPFADFDWIGTIDFLPAGNHPVMLVSTNPLENLSVSDFVGLVFSTSVVPTLGLSNVGFISGSQDARWDTILIGSSGSLQLAAIPEPSTTAILVGVFSMFFVAIRRRQLRINKSADY